MENLGAAAGLGLAVAGSLLLGGLAAALLRLPEAIASILTAFGGGVLLSAVALELVPEADAEAGVAPSSLGLVAGMLAYVGADWWLGRNANAMAMRRSGHAAAAGRPMEIPDEASEAARGESIAAGIFVDGVPESVALGLTIAEGELGGALLAGILIGNLVESYGAAQPIIAGGRSPRFAVTLLGAIGVALALTTVLGATVLTDAGAELVGTAQAAAAGAVLAVVSIAIVPHAFEQVNRTVAGATVAGFIVGYLLS
jgi:zinc transporter, ZIP family